MDSKEVVLCVATLETRNYSFVSCGRTKAEALCAMVMGWERHCLQSGGDPDWILVNGEEIGYTWVSPGTFLRDGEEA